MKLKFKKLDPRAIVPSYAKPGDAGLDLTAIAVTYDIESMKRTYSTGLAVEIPPGHVGLLFPRSSIMKTDLALTNCVGVIDSGYRGEVKAVFRENWQYGGSERVVYNPGDRVVQMIVMPYPACEVEEVQELSSTDRGAGGFGSTGK